MATRKNPTQTELVPTADSAPPPSGAAAAAPPPDERFDQMMVRLESIVGSLERGDLPLEDALRVFEEGVGLVRRGQQKLQVMERRVEVLMTDGSARPLTGAQAPGESAAQPRDGRNDDSPF
jgi:exodeoxyribonuclease VII small subunit